MPKFKELKPQIREITHGGKTHYERKWGYNGTRNRFRQIYFEELLTRPIRHLLRLYQEDPSIKPQIMILGPGIGEDIVSLRENIPAKIEIQIDTLGLTNNLIQDAKKIVREDFSKGKALEEFTYESDSEIIKRISNKYHLVVGAMSVGYHTNNPVINMYRSSSMLSKRGISYIQIKPIQIGNIETLEYHKLLEDRFSRIVRVENIKKGESKNFRVNWVRHDWVEIERID